LASWGSTYGSFERQVEKALAGVPPERIVSISYSTSRIFTGWLQHHALIVVGSHNQPGLIRIGPTPVGSAA